MQNFYSTCGILLIISFESSLSSAKIQLNFWLKHAILRFASYFICLINLPTHLAHLCINICFRISSKARILDFILIFALLVDMN